MLQTTTCHDPKIGPNGIATVDGDITTKQSSVTVKCFRAHDSNGQPILLKLPVYKCTNDQSQAINHLSLVPPVNNTSLNGKNTEYDKQRKVTALLRRNSISGFANIREQAKRYAIPVFSLPSRKGVNSVELKSSPSTSN